MCMDAARPRSCESNTLSELCCVCSAQLGCTGKVEMSSSSFIHFTGHRRGGVQKLKAVRVALTSITIDLCMDPLLKNEFLPCAPPFLHLPFSILPNPIYMPVHLDRISALSSHLRPTGTSLSRFSTRPTTTARMTSPFAPKSGEKLDLTSSLKMADGHTMPRLVLSRTLLILRPSLTPFDADPLHKADLASELGRCAEKNASKHSSTQSTRLDTSISIPQSQHFPCVVRERSVADSYDMLNAKVLRQRKGSWRCGARVLGPQRRVVCHYKGEC